MANLSSIQVVFSHLPARRCFLTHSPLLTYSFPRTTTSILTAAQRITITSGNPRLIFRLQKPNNDPFRAHAHNRAKSKLKYPRYSSPPPPSPSLFLKAPGSQSQYNNNNNNHYRPPSFFIRHPLILPGSVMAICVALLIFAKWAAFQEIRRGNPGPMQMIRKHFISSLTNIREKRQWTLITPSLMHADFMHLLFNMLALYQFGPSVVQLFGPRVFICTWIGSGVVGSVASLTKAVINERRAAKLRPRTLPVAASSVSLGASGSIFGLIALFACAYPFSEMALMMIPVPVPAALMLAGAAGFSVAAPWFGWVPHLDHEAHLGGMAYGVAAYYVLLRFF